MSRRRNLRRRAERAHRCYDCGENDGRLRLYRNRAYCLTCYTVASSSEPRPVTLDQMFGKVYGDGRPPVGVSPVRYAINYGGRGA